MKVSRAAIAAVLLLSMAAGAAAQPSAAQPQSAADKIACQIGGLFMQSLQQQDQMQALQEQLTKAHARIKELEAAPKKE